MSTNEINIQEIQNMSREYINNYNNNAKAIDIFKLDISNDWVVAHCLCILDFIKVLEQSNPTEKVQLESEFIREFQDFNISLSKINGIDPIYTPSQSTETVSHISSIQALNSAEKILKHPKYETYLSLEYQKEIVPFMIRQAIEIKIIQEMLGVDYSYKNNNTQRELLLINLSKYIDFIEQDNNHLFQLPSTDLIRNIDYVNKWTNNFIHTGIRSFSWIKNTAIDIIQPLFQESALYNNFRSNNFIQDRDNKLKNYFRNLPTNRFRNVEFEYLDEEEKTFISKK
ncbi:hypothetical protein [Psychrobacter sp. I-STPA6b]|uniref:hypothetical protein n=1 Tax=Psychrobacter sp. I-STPA6b TaxID=2585718 RepID=UPI001D0CD3BE|nr:hypothetical protein [Psychrobacter sp. I-STPA6b]